jgi:hypothetical protein
MAYAVLLSLAVGFVHVGIRLAVHAAYYGVRGIRSRAWWAASTAFLVAAFELAVCGLLGLVTGAFAGDAFLLAATPRRRSRWPCSSARSV